MYAAYASLFVIILIGQDLLLVVTVFILPVYLKSLLSITETAIFLMAIEAAAVFLQKKKKSEYHTCIKIYNFEENQISLECSL